MGIIMRATKSIETPSDVIVAEKKKKRNFKFWKKSKVINSSKSGLTIFIIMLGLAFFLLCAVIVSKAYGVASSVEQYLPAEWVEPHAWAAEKDPLQQLCPQTPAVAACDIECDKRDLEIAFRKLVHNFFDRSKFMKDESSKYMHRSVHIHATEAQLEKLFKLSKPNDIDGLLAEILVQSNFGMTQLIKEYTIGVSSTAWDGLPFAFDIPPRTREITFNFALLVLTYIICRRLRINFMLVIIFGLVYILYEYLDYECHKRIAVEDTVSFIYGRDKNPCEESTNNGWFRYFFNKNNRAECRDHMLQQSRDGKQCGLVDLFHEFTANILYKQMSMFFMKLADLIQSISSTYGLIVAVITLFFMKDIIKVMIYSIFKFILNPSSWSGFAATARNIQNEAPNSTFPHQIAPGVDIKDINLGKALDLANSKIQLMLHGNANSAATEAHLPTPSVQRPPSIENQTIVTHQFTSTQSDTNEMSSSSIPSNPIIQLEASGMQRLPDESETVSSDSSTDPTSELESYEEITHDELSSTKAVDVTESTKGQTSLGDALVPPNDGKSSNSSSRNTIPSDIELLTDDRGNLNGETDSNY